MYSSESSEPSRAKSISARSLPRRSNTELERIVRKNLHDPVMLGAVHMALKGRTRKKAVRLRTEIRERLALDRTTGAPMPNLPVWTLAPEPPRKPRYRKWRYVLMMLGFVGAGAVHGVGFPLWQMLHQELLSLGERFQLF